MLFCNDSKRPGGFFSNSLVAKKEIIRKNMFIFSVSFSHSKILLQDGSLCTMCNSCPEAQLRIV